MQCAVQNVQAHRDVQPAFWSLQGWPGGRQLQVLLDRDVLCTSGHCICQLLRAYDLHDAPILHMSVA
jgi:hypothetical protein